MYSGDGGAVSWHSCVPKLSKDLGNGTYVERFIDMHALLPTVSVLLYEYLNYSLPAFFFLLDLHIVSYVNFCKN